MFLDIVQVEILKKVKWWFMKVYARWVSDDMVYIVNRLEVKCLGGGPRHPKDDHMSGRNMLVTAVQ
jgi:hypothetical protein